MRLVYKYVKCVVYIGKSQRNVICFRK